MLRICRICKREKELNATEFVKDHTRPYGLGYVCRECSRKDNNARRKIYMKDEEFRNKCIAWSTSYNKRHPDKYKEIQSKLRINLFNAYGNSCKFCGSFENLSLDHVQGDGKQRRLDLGKNTYTHYRDALSEINHDKYQILCKTCNWMKGTLSNKEFFDKLSFIKPYIFTERPINLPTIPIPISMTLRIRLLDMYGRSCKYCMARDINLLELDHVKGNGKQERQNHNQNQYSIYRQAIKSRDATLYQILCRTCNRIKHNLSEKELFDYINLIQFRLEWNQILNNMQTPIKTE